MNNVSVSVRLKQAAGAECFSRSSPRCVVQPLAWDHCGSRRGGEPLGASRERALRLPGGRRLQLCSSSRSLSVSVFVQRGSGSGRAGVVGEAAGSLRTSRRRALSVGTRVVLYRDIIDNWCVARTSHGQAASYCHAITFSSAIRGRPDSFSFSSTIGAGCEPRAFTSKHFDHRCLQPEVSEGWRPLDRLIPRCRRWSSISSMTRTSLGIIGCSWCSSRRPGGLW